MAYQLELQAGQTLVLDNRGTQTVITLASHGPGQQQQASQSLTTGTWISPPEAYRTAEGVLIRLRTAEGDRILQIQQQQIRVLNQIPLGLNLQAIPLQERESVAPAMQPMKPMQPMQMQPMQPMGKLSMGDMHMSLDPMEMRMGDMTLSMGSSSASNPASDTSPTSPPEPADPSASQRRFCSQCGARVQPSDRFCASCGHSLNPAD
jgi:hypothetical protein